ncbi:right-handed parallel beta-helix repeat-containing protein [Actinomadura napierensis]|uniref:Right handed beta helix domain-containing protein n=1 Tax=Actinomadura napierensis TaxID=267854 RepID=A0ABP5M1S8_9ACTN
MEEHENLNTVRAARFAIGSVRWTKAALFATVLAAASSLQAPAATAAPPPTEAALQQVGPRPSSLTAAARQASALPHSAHRRWYLDCSAHRPGDGGAARPFTTLQQANAITFAPADQLLLKRGTTCTGMLQPTGSGTAAKPIVIGAYGNPSHKRPRIDAAGRSTAAVRLADESYITVQDLDLTNAGNTSQLYRGLYITAEHGQVTGVKVQGLDVHDVVSDPSFDHGKPGGGIIAEAIGPNARFSHLTLQGNYVHDVSRSGIWVIGTDTEQRPPADQPWPAATTDVLLRANTVIRPAGDAIVTLGTVGAVIEDNTVREGNLVGRDYEDPAVRNCSAGIWTWNANRTVIQYNDVGDMHFGPSPTDGCDGTGYDVDYNQDGTVVQYNYSHGNQGGFILLCAAQSPRHADIRYNLSVNDAHLFSPPPCGPPYDPAVTNLNGVRMYNNTIIAKTPNVAAEGSEAVAKQLVPFFGTFAFQNNIVYATDPKTSADHYFYCGTACTNNLFFNMPAYGTNAINADPKFTGKPQHPSNPPPRSASAPIPPPSTPAPPSPPASPSPPPTTTSATPSPPHRPSASPRVGLSSRESARLGGHRRFPLARTLQTANTHAPPSHRTP